MTNKSWENTQLAWLLFWMFGMILGGTYLYRGRVSDMLNELTIIAMAICFLLRFRAPTTIAVSPERILVNGRKLKRSEFRGFFSGRRQLGYWYGSRTYTFGGDWDGQRGSEIALAMNYLMHQDPVEEGIDGVLDALRSRRPASF